MRAAAFPLLLALASALAGAILRNGVLVALALMPLVFVAAGALAAPAPPRVRVARRLAASRVSVGQPVEVVLEVTNAGATAQALHIDDQLPAGAWLVDGQPSMTAGSSTMNVRLACALSPATSTRLLANFTQSPAASFLPPTASSWPPSRTTTAELPQRSKPIRTSST